MDSCPGKRTLKRLDLTDRGTSGGKEEVWSVLWGGVRFDRDGRTDIPRVVGVRPQKGYQ